MALSSNITQITGSGISSTSTINVTAIAGIITATTLSVTGNITGNVNVAGILTSVGGLNVGTGGTVITTTAGGDINIDSGGVYYDASNNRLGIGTTGPGESLDVVGQIRTTNTTAGSGLVVKRSDSVNASGALNFTGSDDTVDASIRMATDVADSLTFQTAGTERMRILPAGGITFNADTAAANALDDYEEGTWSPGITSSSLGNGIFSYTVTYAKYTKVGRLVNIAARITSINWTGSPSGYMQITGAPFTKTSNHFPTSAVSMYYTTFGADSYNTIEFITASATTTMYVRTTTNGAVGTDLQIGSVNNGNGGLVMSITYYV